MKGISRFLMHFAVFKKLNLLLLLIVIFYLSTSIVSADPLDNWHVGLQSAPLNGHAVTYGNGVFIAVGHSNIILTSHDATTWTEIDLGSTLNLNDIAYGNALFVTVGYGGVTLFSSDGKSWSLGNSNTSNDLYGVIYGNGTFLAVGHGGTILTSSDGKNWVMRQSGVSAQINDVTFGNNMFIAVGQDQVLTSSNGIDWQSKTFYNIGFSFSLYGIVYGDNTFVITGSSGLVFISTNGGEWEQIDLGSSAHLHSVAYGDGKFVIVSESIIFTSSDGLKWDSMEAGTNLFGITYGNGLFVSVGGGTIINSQDGIKWHFIKDSSVYSIASGNGVFVAAGAYRIANSNDGLTWIMGNTGIPAGFWAYQVAYENGTFMIAGVINDTLSTVLISADGVNWQAVNWASFDMFDVSYENYTYVAAGRFGAIVTSSDGQAWSPSISGTLNHLFGITSGNGLFVAVGNNGTIVTSIDGYSWSLKSVGTLTLYDIAYGKNYFVAVGDNGTILTSPDGISWTDRVTGTTKNLLEITYGKNYFVAVGDNGTILTSLDGINWTIRNSGVQNSLNGITYGNNTFVAVGLDIIIQSDPIISQFNLSISKIGSGNGTVTSNPSGIDCGENCSEQYNEGTIVNLTAIAEANSNFSGWSGCDLISGNTCTVTMNDDKNVTANFSQNCDRSLTIIINPPSAGSVTKNPDKANYCNNEQVSLTANPSTGYSFTSWSGVDSSNGVTAQVSMTSNKTVTANFSQIPVVNYTLSLSKSGSGSVKVDGTTHTLPWSGEFSSGTNVQIEAISDSGWGFTNWTGDYTGSANTTTINISGNKNITANFSQNCDRSLTININPSGSGTVTKNPDKANYCPNEQVTLTASPNSGYTFSLWEGVDSNSETTASITMNTNRTVTVNFNQQTLNGPDISVDPVTQVFANIPVGDSSMPQTLTISNTGSGDLVIGTLSITGDDASQFLKENDTCSGQTVTPSANCTVNVIFSPTSTGSFDSILNIPSNDLDEPNVTLSLKGGSGADITGSWISLFQKCNGANCKINGKFNVQNIGNKDALSSLVRFYLSDDGTYDEGDMFLKQVSTGTLKIGKSKKMSLSYNLPSGISATDKYIIAVIDADNTIMEAIESNNIIIYGPILRANLTGMWTSLTQQCKGDKCKIRGALNIQNIGYQDAASFVKFYLSDDGAYDAGDMFLKKVSIGTLKVNKSKKMSLSYSFPSGVSAYGKYIIAVIDADNTVLEANEGDNNIIYGPLL